MSVRVRIRAPVAIVPSALCKRRAIVLPLAGVPARKAAQGFGSTVYFVAAPVERVDAVLVAEKDSSRAVVAVILSYLVRIGARALPSGCACKGFPLRLLVNQWHGVARALLLKT